MGDMALVELSRLLDPRNGWLVDGLCKVEVQVPVPPSLPVPDGTAGGLIGATAVDGSP